MGQGSPPAGRGGVDGLDGAHAVVTGGAGFLGSHLAESLLDAGAAVTVLDNLLTGSADNVAHLLGRDGFRFVRYDVTDFLALDGEVTHVLHLASPASPRDYLEFPIQTLKVGALGTHKTLGLAREKGARLLLASTSEVYGDPQVHPQPEDYWGHVNPIGPRGVYDEAKRFAEALVLAYHRTHGLEVRIARIFNTFGPRMRVDDGRLIPTLFSQCRAGEPLTLHGDGSQTRSLCYVDDLVAGLLALLVSDVDGPVNLGGENELSVNEIAQMVLEISGADVEVRHVARPEDDPQVRRPDLTRAATLLDWQAQVPVVEGLRRTWEWWTSR